MHFTTFLYENIHSEGSSPKSIKPFFNPKKYKTVFHNVCKYTNEYWYNLKSYISGSEISYTNCGDYKLVIDSREIIESDHNCECIDFISTVCDYPPENDLQRSMIF